MQELPPNVRMEQMLSAPWIASCIYIAAKRDFADIIEAAENHQASIEYIAQAAKVHPVWAHAILQALAKADIFVEVEHHLFKNTPLSDFLRSDHPAKLKWRAYNGLSPRSLIQWSQLDYHLHEVGTSIPRWLWGAEFYELLDQQGEGQATRLSSENVVIELEPREVFDLMVEGIVAFTEPPIAQAYPFKGIVCDLGGGRGSLLTAIAKHHPDVKGILFERPIVIEHLRRQQTAYPFALVSRNFFLQQVPHADIYVLKHVFHNWPDDLCSEILQKCVQANPDAKVLVIEQLIGDPNGFAEIVNVVMMLEQNGRERSLGEYQSIAKHAGFSQFKVYPTGTPVSIVELAL